jgi:hypothetical protein
MPSNISKHVKAPDPIAAISGGLLTLAGMAGIKERFGIELTADEIAEAIGIVITIAASVRHWWEQRKAGTPMTRAELLAELQRLDDEHDIADRALEAVAEYTGRPTGPEFVSGDSDASGGGS